MNSTTIGPSPWMTKEPKVPLVTVRISSNRDSLRRPSLPMPERAIID
jgi:hypothetical protein